jgi:hypothetical protein
MARRTKTADTSKPKHSGRITVSFPNADGSLRKACEILNGDVLFWNDADMDTFAQMQRDMAARFARPSFARPSAEPAPGLQAA